MKTLSREALIILGQVVLSPSAVSGTLAFLPPNLDRKTYLEVNGALEAFGGKWNRKAGAHVFLTDPSDILRYASPHEGVGDTP